MDKRIRRALKTGVDEDNNILHYYCPQCGWDISLMPKRCPKCGGKRPKDAYMRAITLRDASMAEPEPATVYVDRSCGKIPAPKAPCYASRGVEDVIRSCYATDAMAQLGIPKYYTSDEYGRVYETPVSYTTLPGAGPIPIPKPSKTIQTEAIKIPLNITK